MTAKAKAPKSTSGLRRSLANILKSKKKEAAGRQVEGFSVPLECEELTRKSREERITNGCVCEEDRHEPDLRLAPGVDPAAEACREELDAKAGAEERSPRPDRLGDEALLVDEPGMIFLIVHAHRSAHGDDRIEPVPIGKGLAFIELDTMDRRSALTKNVLVDPRRLAGDVLEDERSHLSSWSAFGNLQLASGVEAGSFLDHEGCHQPAAFGLDLGQAETLARLGGVPDRDSDDLVAVSRVALVRTQHPLRELAGSPRTSELIPRAGLQSPCCDPNECLIEFHRLASGTNGGAPWRLTGVRRSAETPL